MGRVKVERPGGGEDIENLLSELNWVHGGSTVFQYEISFSLSNKDDSALIFGAVGSHMGVYLYEDGQISILFSTQRYSESVAVQPDGSVQIRIIISAGGFYEPTMSTYGYAIL